MIQLAAGTIGAAGVVQTGFGIGVGVLQGELGSAHPEVGEATGGGTLVAVAVAVTVTVGVAVAVFATMTPHVATLDGVGVQTGANWMGFARFGLNAENPAVAEPTTYNTRRAVVIWPLT